MVANVIEADLNPQDDGDDSSGEGYHSNPMNVAGIVGGGGAVSTAIWKQSQPSLWGSGSTATTANSSSWHSWSDQRDTSQHSRGGNSIWAAGDDYSRSSHTSQGGNAMISSGFAQSMVTSSLSSQSQQDRRLSVSNNNDDSNNSLEEDSYILETNLAELTICGSMLNHRNHQLNNDLLGSPLRSSSMNHAAAGNRKLPGMSNLGELSTNSSAFHQLSNRNQAHSPTSFFGIQHHYPTSSGASVASSIPGLVGSCSGSTSAAGTYANSVNSSKLNPNRSSWRPHSAPVGSPQKSSLSAALAAARGGTPSPLSSAIAPPPIYALDRSSPSNLGRSNNSNSRSTRQSSVGSKGRDRQRTNRKKQHPHQLNSILQNHPSPQALKEVNNNYKNDLSESSFYSTNNSMMSPMQSRVGGSSLYGMASPSLLGSLTASPGGSSEAIRALLKPRNIATPSTPSMVDPLDQSMCSYMSYNEMNDRSMTSSFPILPQQTVTLEDLYPSYFGETISEDASEDDGEEDDTFRFEDYDIDLDDESESWEAAAGSNPYACGSGTGGSGPPSSSRSKKREWLLRMNRKLQDVPMGELDPAVMPLSAIMNAWAKTKSAQGASMVEMWLTRAQDEYNAGNRSVVPTTKMYTMAGKNCLVRVWQSG